ncbi:DNA primase [compost metagenome]
MIVVEGYMDVVGLAQQGIANAVATLGTATTPDHVKKLLRASDKVIFSFDGDGAGRRAAWRALQACLPVLRDDIAIRFLFLPSEHDPDSYVRELGAEAFRACLGDAVALSRFLLDELASRHNMSEAEGRASCLHEAKPLLATIPECALRVQIEREMAKLVQLTPEEMAQILAQQPAKPFAPAGSKHPSGEGGGAAGVSGSDHDGGHSDMGYDLAGHDFQDIPADEPDYAEYGHIPLQGAEMLGASGQRAAGKPEWKSKGDWKGKSDWKGGKGNWKGRRDNDVGGFEGRRTMPSLAKRLLGLLLAHPELVDSMGDQQLEVIDHGPHLGLVRDLIMLAQSSGARHVGALLEAAEPDSDLATVLKGLRADILSQEDLPDPQTEWDDALRRIEFDSAKLEMAKLASTGLATEEARKRYLELSGRMAVLKNAGIR